MPTSIFLSHNHNDKAFVRRLAMDLKQAGATVWIDDAEIKVGDSLIAKIEAGLLGSDYLGVVLSPDSVASNWVQAELRAILTQEITDQKVRVLPILYRDCNMPLFLRDKLAVDFRKGSYRKSLTRLLWAMGLSYEPIRKARIEKPWEPLAEAVERILNQKDPERQRLLATALHVSIHAPWIANERDIAIPTFIEREYGVRIDKQCGLRISFSKNDAYTYLRDKGRIMGAWKKKKSGLDGRYRQKFGREPAQGPSGPGHFVFSYGELFEWFTIPEDSETPEAVRHLVMEERLPEIADS